MNVYMPSPDYGYVPAPSYSYVPAPTFGYVSDPLSYGFVPDPMYYSEVQALYIALFDNPQASDSAALLYWEGQFAANPAGAMNAISNYASYYDGQPLSSSNIESGINTIYENLFGTAVSSNGAAYWASQWSGDGGSMSIGEIVISIYDAVENYSTTSSNYEIYTEVMNNRIINFYNEAQAMYISLFGYQASQSGLTYWENYLATDYAHALDSISAFAGLDGALIYGAAALTTSNIGAEINNIYEIIFGRPVDSGGLTYWTGQWTGEGGNLSIGQIVASMYNYVESQPYTYNDYQAMNGILSGDNFITMFNWTEGNITTGQTNPVPYALTTTDAGYTFASGTQSDTLVISFGYSASSLGTAGNGAYFTFQGDASGHNIIDISYVPQYTSNLSYYLEYATNFQILDFNSSTGLYFIDQSPLDLSTINSGFNTFILDGTYVGSNNSYSGYGFINAPVNDMFVVQATTADLLIGGASSGNATNIIMDGGASGVGLGLLYYDPYFAGVSVPVINIDSIGTAANTILLMGDLSNSGNNLTGSFTLNFYGSDPLSIGSALSLPYSVVSTVDNGIELNDGSTLTINSYSSGSSLTAYIYENSLTQTLGVTVNASGFSGTLNLIEDQYGSVSPDKFILGSGTDSVATNNGNAIITVGSGMDTIVANSTYSSDSAYYLGQTTAPGYITVIQGNIGPNDSIIFGTPYGLTPADWVIYPGATGSSGEGISVSSLMQYNESAASSVTAAISAVIATLEGDWMALNNSNSTQDFAGWFQYGGNTYIVNSVALQNQVVELVGTYTISPSSVGHLTMT